MLGGEYRERGVGGWEGWWCWEVSTGGEEWVGGRGVGGEYRGGGGWEAITGGVPPPNPPALFEDV